MAALPPKGDAISVVDSDAVSPGELPLELITSIARRNPEISEAKRDIERLELPLHDAPQTARHSPRKMRVARAKEINGVSSPNDWVTTAHYILHRNCVVIKSSRSISPQGPCRARERRTNCHCQSCWCVQKLCGRAADLRQILHSVVGGAWPRRLRHLVDLVFPPVPVRRTSSGGGRAGAGRDRRGVRAGPGPTRPPGGWARPPKRRPALDNGDLGPRALSSAPRRLRSPCRPSSCTAPDCLGQSRQPEARAGTPHVRLSTLSADLIDASP